MIRELDAMSPDELRLIARDAADAGQPIPEWEDAQATHAVAFERHYFARLRELQECES